jgi:hypothetical protein
MVWYGAPHTPRHCVLSLRVVAPCSVGGAVGALSQWMGLSGGAGAPFHWRGLGGWRQGDAHAMRTTVHTLPAHSQWLGALAVGDRVLVGLDL